MNIELRITPQPLSANLASAASLGLIAAGLGLLQIVAFDQQAWWTVEIRSLNGHLPNVFAGLAIGVLTAVCLYAIGRKLWPRDASWAFRALAAIRPTWYSALLLSVFAAIFEELLFRAALISSIGFSAATILFALVHYGLFLFAPSRTAAFRAFIELAFVGTVFGYTYLQFGLLAAIVCHLSYNLVGFFFGQEAWWQAHTEWLKSGSLHSTAASPTTKS